MGRGIAMGISIGAIVNTNTPSDCDCDYCNKPECFERDVRYMLGETKPHYPVPALRVEVEYWPSQQTDSGKSELYIFDQHRPGRWREWLHVIAFN